ncbi:MAG TPA: 2-dehydropantoate 2-reductase, partial [Terriglobia bacterium]|nr:2-dehydropantoate 2-reductase [Terriglobia bacterium]
RAMKEKGVRVIGEDGEFTVHPTVVDDLAEAGTADFVFLGVKAHGLSSLAPKLGSLQGPTTTFVSTQNGVPWWYFQRHGGELDGARLERLDPDGAIEAAIAPDRVLGSIAYFATEVTEPGVIRHVEGNRLSLGEPDNSKSDRIKALSEALVKAGLRAPITTRIRHEIWVKILGNMTFNPVSALTGATLVQMTSDPDVSTLIRGMMGEAEAVAAKLGIELPISIDQRMAGAAKVGAHKTSMLQDIEAGRPIEIEALVGAVIELGDRLGIPMPQTRAIYAATKLLDQVRRGH